MPVRNIGLLPEIFRTDPNEKFINATIEQLTNEPNLKRVNGYIGKKFTSVNKPGDNYIQESTVGRNQYQLEPAVIVPDVNGKPVFTGHYLDLLNKLGYYGANTSDQTRLFNNEYYSYDSQINYDKFVNFSQYYWLPQGPDAVSIFSEVLPTNEIINVTRTGSSDTLAEGVGNYQFDSILNQTNPLIILSRNGTYNFAVDQAPNPFWIQTEPGISGQQISQSNFSTREIHGVVNNGEDNGIVTFNVPDANAQNFFTDMTDGIDISFANSGITYDDIQGRLLSDFIVAFNGIDENVNIEGKTFIFIDNSINASDWTATQTYTTGLFGGTEFGTNIEVPVVNRTGIWKVHFEVSGDDFIIHLTSTALLLDNVKHKAIEGVQFNDRLFYKDTSDQIQLIPLITALQDTFYYQDGNDANLVGIIKLVNVGETFIINILEDIINLGSYTSPNGVKFTNGLKIAFNEFVFPEKFQNKEFYVEGVGDSITLTEANTLVTPETYVVNALEPYDSVGFDTTGYEGGADSPTVKDYITINLASVDKNPWSRSNRWFHVDVLQQTADLVETELVLETDLRANRPIIEFNANLKLFDFGLVAINPINLQDTIETDALSNIHGSLAPLTIDGINVQEGDRVVFLADKDENVKKTIYTVGFIDANNDAQLEVNLVPDTVTLEEGNTFLVQAGLIWRANTLFLSNGVLISSQDKTKVNQPPLFDVYDLDGNKLSDISTYVNSSFTGTKIFSYSVGTGIVDPPLGFALTYRNFQSVGDIVFNNNFDADTFSFTTDDITNVSGINIGLLHKTTSLTTRDRFNTWTTIAEPSRQSQLFTYDNNGTALYQIDIDPVPEKFIKHYHVYVDNTEIKRSDFQFTVVDDLDYIEILIDITDAIKIDILIYSIKTSTLAIGYEVPFNLENNAQNNSFDDLTLGQIRNHVNTAFSNSNRVTGVFPGQSDLRDLPFTLSAGGDILQHSAGLPYANLFLLDDKSNFIDAVTHAQAEYARFKYKFTDLATRLDIDVLDTVAATDQILAFINDVKTADFPWYASDMVPYGDDTTITEYTVTQIVNRDYELVSLYDNTTVSNKAALVYINGIQTVNQIDFLYNSKFPRITILDTYPLVVGDTVKLVEYNNTDGNWIPETPSKMGLYPAFTPARIVDDAFVNNTEVIRGHDGSVTPVYGDFRDDLLLELEKRIFNNIKTQYDENRLSINSIKPGKFRETEYSLTEFNNTLARYFYRFVGENKLDYRTDPGFDSNNSFTYNYRKYSDKIDNEVLQGYWKAIYNYYYDTIHPNTQPWEMLGFSARPLWWVDTYGPAPYTSGNLILWSDLELGKIAAGDRAGIDPVYARPGLLDIIPVNQFGDLLSPNEFLVNGTAVKFANEPFIAGEEGPVETAWRNSSQFPFAMQIIIALLKPAEYFGLFADLQNYNFNTELKQFLFEPTNQRLTQTDIMLNGEIINGVTERTASYINWITDFIKSDNISPTLYLGNILDRFRINLAYKVAGFTDKKLIKVIAEQSSPSSTAASVIIPDEDFFIELNTTAPLIRVSYSSVIVERTSVGFRVDGYNLGNPHFTILPSIENTNTSSLTVLNETIILFKSFSSQPISIPYGFVFDSKKSLIDFLAGYQRFLERQGFLFNVYDNILVEVKNWLMSAKEFLYWTQQGWGDGNVIVLNPVGDRIHMNTPGAVVAEIKQTSPHSIVDQNFQPIPDQNFTVKRIDNEFQLQILDGRAIGFLEISLVQHEHILIFNNITVFNDIIYQAELGNRQLRLRLVGQISNNWNGSLAPAGYIYNDNNVEEWQQSRDYRRGDIVTYKSNFYVANTNLAGSSTFDYSLWSVDDFGKFNTGLIPNFSNLARAPEDFYEIDNVNLESQTDLFGKGLIGFRRREYFDQLGLDDTSQIKFYQGMIQKKGTISSVQAMTRARLRNDDSDIQLFEEWALRVGAYGATDSTAFIETRLNEGTITSNPVLLAFKNAGDIATVDAENKYPKDIFASSTTYDKDLFLKQEVELGLDHTIKTAGLPILSDATHALFSWDDFDTLNDFTYTSGIGQLIWVAKETNNDWNIYRISGTGVKIRTVTLTGTTLEMDTNIFHNLIVGDRILMRGMDRLIDGWYVVSSIKDLNTFSVESTAVLDDFVDIALTTGQLYKLVSNRVADQNELIAAATIAIQDGEKLFVDLADANENWNVIEKGSPWIFNSRTGAQVTESLMNFGNSVALSADSLFIYAGAPDANGGAGSINIASKNNLGVFNTTTTLFPTNPSTSGYGTSVDTDDGTHLAIGAPTSSSNSGQVYIYKFNTAFTLLYELTQIITIPSLPIDYLFGTVVELSEDGSWLYVTTPGRKEVRAYSLVKSLAKRSEDFITNTLDATPSFTPIFAIPNINSLVITDNKGRTYIPEVDYTISGTVTVTADAGTILSADSNTVKADTDLITADSLSEIHADALSPTADVTTSSTITFTAPFVYGSASNITITFTIPEEYYLHVNTLIATPTSGNTARNSLSTNADGSQLLVGIIPDTADLGTTLVYDRMVEKFVATANQTSYRVDQNFNSLHLKVIAAGVELVQQVDYTLDIPEGDIILTIPSTEGDIIQIETNDFVLLTTLTPATGDEHVNDHFGWGVEFCSVGCVLLVGMPNHDESLATDSNNGIVYNYINQARRFGTITSTVQNPIVTIGDSIRIDNVNIFFTGTSLTSVIFDINIKGIPGVTAKEVDGRMVITSDSRIDFAKLTVLPGRTDGSNTGFTDIGFDIYPLATIINSPLELNNERFGESIEISDDNKTVVVGSSEASTIIRTTIDASTTETTFDANSTCFGTLQFTSGSVSVFEFISVIDETLENMGQFVFAQQLVGDNITAGDRFGIDLAINDNLIIVGSPNDLIGTVNAGTIYGFTNDNREPAWKVIRTQETKIDVNSINKVYLYDKTTNLIISSLDYIDPVKGKLLGIAQNELDYLTTFDPAKYNFSIDPDLSNEKIHWNNTQTGRLWWDLSTIRYLEYEQIDAKYKFQNWGNVFPGSSVDIYEWVQTDVVPSAYVAAGHDGVPKDIDDSLYTQISFINTQTGLSKTSFFYWVKDKIEVDQVASPFRSITSTQVAEAINNPKGQGIPYAEFLDSSSVGLVNVTNKLSDDDIILHIDYDVIPNDNVIHSEYALIQEGGITKLPTKIINKLIDSLSGIDSRSLQVPDQNLPISSRTGIDIRPRQSMFINRPLAVKAMVLSVNNLLKKFRIIDIRTMPLMFSQEEIPTADSGEYNEVVATIEFLQLIDVTSKAVGYKTLVLTDSTTINFWVIYELSSDKEWIASRVQAFDTTRYWTAIDWYENGFDATTTVDITLQTRVELHKLESIIPGAIIKVLDNGNSQFELLQEVDGSFRVVGVEASTVEISNSLYDPTNGAGFDTLGFDLGVWDASPQEETRRIVESILNEILIDELSMSRNELFFVLIRHILAEQSYVDWIFKTSFVSVRQEFDGLQQFPVFQRTTQTFLEDYINEIKPYRTKIREFLLDQLIADIWDGDVTDFDIPAYYDFNLKRFRSPSGEQPGDQALLDTAPEYFQWNNNHKYNVATISVEDGGSGYNDVVPPGITIVGGGGTGAEAVSEVEAGVIIKITVTKSGSGYTTTPTIIFETGAGAAARAYAHLANDTIRKMKITMKFDRVTYDTVVVDWAPNRAYVIGDIIAFNGNAFSVITDFTSSATFNSTNLAIIPLETFDNANDRTWAAYQPTSGMIDRDLGKLYQGIDYPGVQVIGPILGGSGDFDSIIDGGELDTDFSGARPGEIDIDGAGFVDTNNVFGPEELVPGRVFETIDIQVYSVTDAPTNSVAGVCYRQFMNIGGDIQYLRISDTNSALLTTDLLFDDTTITVDDTSNLGIPNPTTQTPGVLFVNGERITYYVIDNATTLSQIIRGTQGTSIPAVTSSGERVVDGGIAQKVPTVTTRPRIDTVNEPWIIWNKIVNSNNDLLALDVNDFSPGAIALVLFPANPSNTQESFKLEETAPSVFEWIQTNFYIDIEWHDRDPFSVNVTDGESLETAVTLQATFLQAELGFIPTDP